MQNGLKLPAEIVAKVLDIDIASLDETSAYGETPNWDSLNHLDIINELEKSYKIQIPNDEIEKYMTLKSINDLYHGINKSEFE